MDTYYLVTAWQNGQIVREMWANIKVRGKTLTGAEIYAQELRRLFSDFAYTVRPVTSADVDKHIAGRK